tara:strand:- start:62 stop:415 length:354 start_codon:yes stop_codon:yes gene_type:complete
MIQINFFEVTVNLISRCNLAASFEGVIFDKMLVDTMYDLPEIVPMWAKHIMFYFMTIPLNLLTVFDDIVTGMVAISRIYLNYDMFNVGIIVGKVIRELFQIYLFFYMLWWYQLSQFF